MWCVVDKGEEQVYYTLTHSKDFVYPQMLQKGGGAY